MTAQASLIQYLTDGFFFSSSSISLSNGHSYCIYVIDHLFSALMALQSLNTDNESPQDCFQTVSSLWESGKRCDVLFVM